MIVVSVKDGLLGKEWLGRRIDEKFINDLSNLDESIDACGENGEFHTLVTDCPIFEKRILISGSEQELRDGYWFLNAKEFSFLEK